MKRLSLEVFACMFFFFTSADAQFTTDFQTNVISTVVSNWVGNGTYVVGPNFVFDDLLLQNGGVLSNGTGTIGGAPGANNNGATVSGFGSAWKNSGDLNVGYYGARNGLTIGGAATVSDSGNGYVGLSSGSDSNVVFVSGQGSSWTSGNQIFVGYGGAVNQLIITNGAKVHIMGCSLSLGFLAGSSNNVATVIGLGSYLNNNCDFHVGNQGAGNTLMIKDGGFVDDEHAYIGHYSGSDNNRVVVSGSGSGWGNDELRVGTSGANNQLTITNGGGVGLLQSCTIGDDASSSNNSVSVAGTNSFLQIDNSLYVGSGGAQNELTIGDGGAVYINGSFNAYVGYQSGSDNNGVLVKDTGSLWRGGNLYVGYQGTHSHLIITNGGTVHIQPSNNVDSTSCFIGFANSNGGNTVQVAGAGSVLAINDSLYVGYDGSSNQVTVTAGGSVITSNAYIGYNGDSVGNQVVVSGGNLFVTNSVGNGALDVRNGSLVLNSGLVEVNELVMTNKSGTFIHTGGMLMAGSVILDPNTFRISSIVTEGNDLRVTWLMCPGQTNTLQATSGGNSGGYATSGFTDIFIVTNNATVGSVTNYLDIGAATNGPSRFYRARLVP